MIIDFIKCHGNVNKMIDKLESMQEDELNLDYVHSKILEIQ